MNHHHDDNPNHKRASKKKPQPQCTDSNTVRFRPKHASPHLIADLPQQQYPSLVLSPEFFVKAFFLLYVIFTRLFFLGLLIEKFRTKNKRFSKKEKIYRKYKTYQSPKAFT